MHGRRSSQRQWEKKRPKGGGSSGPYAQGGGGEGLKDVLHSSGESGTAAA
jgi:hypothetical protein